jgi:hypothetical protein
MTSEVIAEPETEAPAEGLTSGWSWAEEDRHRALEQRLAMDRARTRAEGFDA